MLDGKKSVAELIVYEALKTVEAKTGKPALEVLESAVKTVTPVLEVKGRRVGGANYQVPVEVPQRRARTLAVRWLVTYARERREKGMGNWFVQAPGGPLDGAHDAHVRAAAAKIVIQRLLDVLAAGTGVVLQKRRRLHDHAIDAVPALRGLFRDECGLQRMGSSGVPSPSSVTILALPTADTGVTQERIAVPSMRTVQAPHSPAHSRISGRVTRDRSAMRITARCRVAHQRLDPRH